LKGHLFGRGDAGDFEGIAVAAALTVTGWPACAATLSGVSMM